jgi:hypothetical protein
MSQTCPAFQTSRLFVSASLSKIFQGQEVKGNTGAFSATLFGGIGKEPCQQIDADSTDIFGSTLC